MQSCLKAEPDTWLLNLYPNKVTLHGLRTADVLRQDHSNSPARSSRQRSLLTAASSACCMLLCGKQMILAHLSTAYYVLKYLLPSQSEERNISLLDIMKNIFPVLNSWKLERWPKKIPNFWGFFFPLK